MKPLELDGKQFGSITVIKRVENSKAGKSRWLCRCGCGAEWVVTAGNLKRIKGCKECSKKIKAKKHGDSGTRLYNIYLGMMNRCNNKANYSYSHYGNRGISVCDEWKNDYLVFKQWALANNYDDTKSIERIDVNGNYDPGNCEWIDMRDQVHNRTNSRRYQMNGRTLDVAQWAKEYNINYYTLLSRLDKGMDIKAALEWERR